MGPNKGENEEIEIQSIKELVDIGLQHVPPMYVRPPIERPYTSNILNDLRLPIISLGGSMHDPDIINQVAHACSQWGAFQVTNHNISKNLQDQIWEVSSEFFALPVDTKLDIIANDPTSPLKFFTGFAKNERIREWKDTLGYKPGPSCDTNLIPKFLRNPLLEFQEQINKLADVLSELISESLDLEPNVFKKHLLRKSIGINYYPPCPQPHLTFGLSPHSDFGSLTIIMQDGIGGLQIRKGDYWFNVEPLPNTFVVLLGDQLEILTNGHYKSVEHRAVTNKKDPRMSIACFFGPDEHDKVGPLEKFTANGKITMYKETIFSDYLKNGFSKGLRGKANLEFSIRNPIISM